jgi:hypothetical protein
MEYKNFESLLLSYKNLWNKLSELEDLGFDLYEGKFKLMEDIENMLYISLKNEYNEEGVDWVSWFMFENDFGKKDWSILKLINEDKKTKKSKYGAFNEKGKPIFYSMKNTWKILEKEYKKTSLVL